MTVTRECVVCGSTVGVQTVAITVAGDPLRLQPDLCTEHRERLILRYGQMLGQLLRRDQTGVDDQRLLEMAHELETQDNACTAVPMYIVQQLDRQFGLADGYSDEYAWIDGEGGIVTKESDAVRFAEFERIYNSDGVPSVVRAGSDWTRVGYRDSWKFVQPFMTLKAAEQFRVDYAHHMGESRVYVESGNINPEWKFLREIIAQFRGPK